MIPSTTTQSQPRPSGESWRSDGLPILVLVAILVLAYAAVHYKKQKWNAFAKEHNCQVSGKMTGDVSPTVGVSPQSTPVVGVAIESDKVGWKCHDGVTYWR